MKNAGQCMLSLFFVVLALNNAERVSIMYVDKSCYNSRCQFKTSSGNLCTSSWYDGKTKYTYHCPNYVNFETALANIPSVQVFDKALRYNEGKAQIHMVPKELIEEVAKVLMFGATKYAKDNWKKGLSYEGCYDSCMRHLLAFNSGEEFDKESNLPHLAHAACNIAFMLYFKKYGEKSE